MRRWNQIIKTKQTMARKGSVISKLWDAMFKLLLSCFWHRKNTAGKKEDLAATLPSSHSHNTDVHDLSNKKAEHRMEEESSQWIAVDNSLQVSNKSTSGKEEHLPKVKSQENGTDDPTRHLENHFVPDLGNDINPIQDRVDAEVVGLNNSVHYCLPTKASTHQKMESDKASEQTKASALENPTFIQGSMVGIQSIQEHQEAKVVQQLICSNGGPHLDKDVQEKIEETESTKLDEHSNENELFPVEVKCEAVVQEAEVDLMDSRNLNDQGKDGVSASAEDTTLSSSRFPDYLTPSIIGSKLPSDTTKPIVLIGTTVNDIRPIRTLLQERWHQKYNDDRQVGKVILYFWCKHPDLDRFYEDELLKFHEEHLVTHMHADFIREADHMVYVDHFLTKHGYDAWDLIDRQQASVFVCGDATAGLKVEKAIIKIAAEIGGKGADNAQVYLKELRLDGRFITEFFL